MSQVKVHPSPTQIETDASALTSPATKTLAQDNDKCFTKQLAFRAGDEFFHGMISYRVNSEGPNGNNLASLLWHSCCQFKQPSSSPNSKADESIQQSFDAVNHFGKWPSIFPPAQASSSGVRVFLDQKNLRPGFDWRGTGNRADGGFLGALSSSLTLVPLLSATPARFKIKPSGSEGRFQFQERGNFAIQEPLEIFCESVDESSSGKKETKHLLCTDFHSFDNSFILKSAGGETLKPESIQNASFWTSRYILPSNGSGPKGSVSEMLTIMQKEEHLSFHVKRSSGFVMTLEVVELSDHVFFKSEEIWLQLDQNSEKPHKFAIEAVEVQGSKIGEIKSVIHVKPCDENLRLTEARECTIRGKTMAIDRKDNVLIEFMLARALHMILAADNNPHPCKIILPVFVDDLSVIGGTSKFLSTEFSRESAEEVKKCLLQILKKDALSIDEEKKLINVSIKDAIQFFSNLQGCQLSKKEAHSMSLVAKAELVRSSILTTVGIEAASYAREQYVSNNPLAYELLDFIKQQDIGHIERSLVKFGVTSVKTFSKLSSESIKAISEDSLEISKKSIVKETADISCAIDAAKDSPYILPLSRRLAIFEDNDASFMTIIYSTFAVEQSLTKPFFGKYILGIVAISFSFLCAYQFYKQEFVSAVVNLPRAVGLCATLFSTHVLKSVKLGRSNFLYGFFFTGIACIVGVFIDKIENGSINWDSSNFCINNYDASKQWSCVLYLHLYYIWQAIFWIFMAVLIQLRQELAWRCGNVGVTLYLVFNMAFNIHLGSAAFIEFVGVFGFPSLLMTTEALKFYGTLKAIRTTERGRQILSKIWKSIKDEDALKNLAKFLSEQCSCAIRDQSKDLGKWKANIRVMAEPPKIHQPTSDFDELYLRATTFNDFFQMWIESIFVEPENSRSFVYKLNPSVFEPPLKGKAIRGPVKRPNRAIAKVYRSYRGDVTLLTDIVRCAVQFETPADMLRFVEKWLFLYGKPQTRDPPKSMFSRWLEEFREFMLVVTNSSISEYPTPNQQSDLQNEHNGKIFEILRIRNRLDPELENVPGGYRDFAIKINIGFYRNPESNDIQIVPLEHWERLPVKFLIVEMQLLLKDLEGDSGMHESYVEMRNKLAN